MIINIDTPDNKEFFRVKKMVDKLRNSEDYNKDRMVFLSSLLQL